MVIIATTLVVLGIFTYLVTATPLGRSMRACEQDRTMAGLLGIDTDKHHQPDLRHRRCPGGRRRA